MDLAVVDLAKDPGVAAPCATSEHTFMIARPTIASLRL